MSRVLVVGAGVVGSATGKGFALHGHDVTFCDISPARVDQLRTEGWSASTTVDLAGPPAFVFLVVPTPACDRRYDLRAVRAAVLAVGDALREASEFHTVVMRSTVPPGTCDSVVVPLLEEISGQRAGEHFAVASNPEFLRAASAQEDFLHPWMTVIGARSQRTIERLLELYRPLGGEFRVFPTPVEAELVKCAHNLFNAAKISFWNELWQVARQLGVDCDPIAATVARSAEGSFNPDYGTRGGRPFLGACLPKDTEGFLGFATDLGLPMPLLASVIEVNLGLLAASNGASHSGAVSDVSDELLDLHR
ncbi:MAG: UDP-glucose/GDP-mannose dehydrogenase family protein [Actinomycetota bacterium]|nr:UDP-glucose/GDP-mannose dehydrogenase family protein [Actinomycetota bacterium]